MLFTLLPHQERCLDSIFSCLNRNMFVVITGASGCGKSYCFQWLQSHIEEYNLSNIIILDGDYFSSDRDYSPFKKTLFTQQNNTAEHIKKGVTEVAKDTPFVGNFVGFIVSSFFKPGISLDINILNEEEQIIVNQLKKLVKDKKSYIVCDNIHWWDRRSLQLLTQLLQSDSNIAGLEFKDVKFILSITDNQNNSQNDIILNILNTTKPNFIVEFPAFTYLDFKKQLCMKTKHNLSEQQMELLYSLVNGHLKVFFEVVNEINRNSFDFNSEYESNKTYLNEILNKRLKECGATGVQITEVLEYASIIGISFSSFELEKLTDFTKAKVKKIIDSSISLRLTEHISSWEHYRFAHDIIREIFKSRVDENHVEYYLALSLCLKEIKPAQYFQRARYMMFSLNTSQAAILFCLEYIAQMRVYGNISNVILQESEHILNHAQKEFLSYMEQAYIAYNNKNYDVALKHMNLILDYYPDELLAERDILKLRCYSKKLATDEISDEIKRLDKKRGIKAFNGEKEVQERYSHSLITAYAHLGEIKRAREIEEDLLKSLTNRLDFDDAAVNRLYVTKRNANAIHGIDTSPIFVKQAVDYFGERNNNGTYRNIIQYYTALINYSAVLIKQGNFLDAYNQTLEAFRLEQDNAGVLFPRPQILRNNFILAGVLENKITFLDAISLYQDILLGLPGVMAEKIFYTSNQSIMYALNNQPDRAYQALYEESLKYNIKCDREGIYRYRVVTNCAIYNYLMGKQNQATDNLIKQSSVLSGLINGSYFQKKNEILIKILRAKTKTTGQQWIEVVHKECPSFQGTPWRYFGLGYAFAALCDWGI